MDFFLKLKNVGLNVGLNKTEKAFLRLLIGNPDRTADMITAETRVSKRTIERTFVSLQKKGNILIQFYKAKRLSEELSFSEKPFLHIKLCYSALAIAILKSF